MKSVVDQAAPGANKPAGSSIAFIIGGLVAFGLIVLEVPSKVASGLGVQSDLPDRLVPWGIGALVLAGVLFAALVFKVVFRRLIDRSMTSPT